MPAAEAERDLGLAGARSRGEAERLAVLAGERSHLGQPARHRAHHPDHPAQISRASATTAAVAF
jgi:hypothetical protein